MAVSYQKRRRRRSNVFVILFRAQSTKTDVISIFEMGKFNFGVRANQ